MRKQISAYCTLVALVLSFQNQKALAQMPQLQSEYVGAIENTDASGFCLDPKPKPNWVSPKKAVNFVGWEKLSTDQKRIFITLYPKGEEEYIQLGLMEDGRVSTFLSVTQALSEVSVDATQDLSISALSLVVGLKEIRTDRLIAYLDVPAVTSLMKGVHYHLTVGGKVKEAGKLSFYDRSTLYAGLHCGYDINWYTNTLKTPHIHWNMRFSDGQSDLHLDGYTPFFWGFIPNLLHLTYPNSDVRYWLSKFTKKYGPAPFSLVPRKPRRV